MTDCKFQYKKTVNSFGDRSFSATGPHVRNSLPPHLQQDMNFERFQHKGKHFCLGINPPWCIETVCYSEL